MPVQNPRKLKLTPIVNKAKMNNEISTPVDTVSRDDTVATAAATVGSDLAYDPASFRPAESVSRASTGSGTGAVTIVMTPDNGNRITISAAIMAALGNPDTVQVQIGSDTVAIATEFANPSSSYNIRKTGKKGVIYNAALVREVVKALSLDFSDRTTVTLYQFKIFDNDGNPVAVVKQ